jgi:hypothetical protein
MKYELREWLHDAWHAFWYHLIYKSKTIGNYRKTINRFTGVHKVYLLSPLERVGVNFSQEQVNFINELLRDERTVRAQELVLEEIEKSMNFDGLAEAFIKAAQELEEKHHTCENGTIRICINSKCGWIGPEQDCLDYKHPIGARLCPECYEVTEKS